MWGGWVGFVWDLVRRCIVASLRLCTLLDKPSGRVTPITADYVGFTIPDRYVVGYGLDHEERYRNLPYIGALPQPSAAEGQKE